MIDVIRYEAPGDSRPTSTQAYLSRALKLDGEIDCKLEQIAQLKSRMTRCTQMLSGMPGSGLPSDWTDTFARIVDMESELKADIDRLIHLKREIKLAIDTVENVTYRQLLELRYLCGWSWRRIAEKMHYERTRIWELHREALEAVKIANTGEHQNVV